MKLLFLSIWFLDALLTADVAAFVSSNHAVRSSWSSSSLSLLGGDESINILIRKRRRVLGAAGTTKRIPASAAVAVAVGPKTSRSSRSTISGSSNSSRNPSSSKRKQNKHQKVRPYHFNSIEAVHAYAHLGNIEQADTLLKEICVSHFSINSRRFSSSSTRNNIRKTKLVPNVNLFNTVLKACARSKVKKAPEKVQSILQFMKEQTTIQPNVMTYNTIMDCWAKSKRPNAGEKAEAYLREMIIMSQNNSHLDDDHQQTTTIVQPDTISYNTVINAYANVGDANRAQYILNTMLCQNNDDKNNNNNNKSEQPHSMINIFDDDVDVVLPSSSSLSVQPNVRSFNTVLMAWSKSNEKKAPEMAEAILHSMKKQQTMDTPKPPSLSAATNDHQKKEEHLFTIDDQNNIVLHYNVQPDIISYNTVINCWSKSQRADSGTRAEAILREMMSEEGVTPDTITYSTVMNAYANIGNADRAEQIVNEMYDQYYNLTTPSNHNYNGVAKPTVECFSTVLKAWSKSKETDAPERATALLERMKDTANMIQPNMVSYTTVMDCWAKSGRPDAGEQAEQILREMEELSSESPKYAHLQPNIISYNTVINAYANNGNAEKAESILDELCIGALVQNIKKSSYQQQQQGEKAKPNVRTFTTVLKSWAKRAASEEWTTTSEEERSNDAPEKAEILLERMKDLSNNNVLPDLAPNRVSYTAVMDCWANAKRDNSGKQAEAILREMIRLSSTSPDMSPTLRSYNTVINAYANLGDAHNAEIILKELLSPNQNNNNGSVVVTPNICSFNTVLKAYSKTRSPKHALQNAERIVNVLNNNHNHNDNNKEQQNLSLLDIKPDAATNKILKSIRRRNDNNNKRRALR